MIFSECLRNISLLILENLPELQMRKYTLLPSIMACLILTGCGTLWKTTDPIRTSLDQILVSTAAERAAHLLVNDDRGQAIPNLSHHLGKSFIDAKNFKENNVTNFKENTFKSFDELYALQAIRNSFLAAGVVLVDDIKKADTVIEVATGALSTDTNTSLLGIPAMAIPIPLAGNVQIPEILLYKKASNRGLAKFSISLYDAHTGQVKGKPFTTVGTATFDSWEFLLLFKIIDNDLQLPNEYESFNK